MQFRPSGKTTKRSGKSSVVCQLVQLCVGVEVNATKMLNFFENYLRQTTSRQTLINDLVTANWSIQLLKYRKGAKEKKYIFYGK